MVATPTAPVTVEAVYGQADRDYRKHPYTSQSELKEVLRSPAHYLGRYGPNAEPSYPSAAMILGTALHSYVLEPHKFPREFCNRAEVAKEPTVAELKAILDEAGTEYPKTAKKDALIALAYPDGLPVEKRTTLAAEDYAAVLGMARSIKDHQAVRVRHWFDRLTPGWTCNEASYYCDALPLLGGLPAKARLDRVIVDKAAGRVSVLDLKSTDDASPLKFQRKAIDLGYDVQAAVYSHFAELAYGMPVDFYFLCVEKRAPYCCAVYQPSADMIAEGARKAAEAARILAYLRTMPEGSAWPSYGGGEVMRLDLPGWARYAGNRDDF
jgi:PDDEXK-like domain of unknown function (DUF3799)/HeH/LEM domain